MRTGGVLDAYLCVPQAFRTHVKRSERLRRGRFEELVYDCDAVRLLKSIFTLLLLAVWLPATAHCRLEALGVIAVDQCCETNSDGKGHSDSACKDVEDGSYKTECAAILPAPSDTVVILSDLCVVSCPTASEGVDVTQTEFQTHHLPQFVIRTAQPIRGPSLVS
jgi:hypothetical protein